VTILSDVGENKVKKIKVIFLVAFVLVSLCFTTTVPVNSQQYPIIWILADGSIVTSTNATVPIERQGNLYTFTDNIENYYLVVERNNIVIDGAGYYLVSHGEVGVDLSYRSNVTIRKMNIMSSINGIYLLNSTGITISDNMLSNNHWGIYLMGSDQNRIIGNNVTGNDIGINLMSSSQNILRNNVMNNVHNLAVYGSQPPHFDNDIDTSNTVNGKKVYYLISQSNLDINPSTYPDLGYLALVNCQNITVSDLEITHNIHGILLAYTSGASISENRIVNNYIGVALFASTNNLISGNYIADNYRGVQLSNASNTNSISSNEVMNNTQGIFFYDSFLNTVVGNNVTNNEIGIGFRESAYNMIRGNYFIDNDKQVYDVSTEDPTLSPSENVWSAYPLGGNYWSDYTGADVKSGEKQDQEGSDGFGDRPYIIDVNNNDSYPLMPYGSPPAITIVSPKNTTYNVKSVTLSYTVSEPTVWVKYSLDGQANVTVTGDTVLSDLTNGVHSITVYAQDTDGKVGSETVYFTIDEGAQLPLETTESELPLTWIAAIIVVVVVAAALVFFLKVRKK